jgi:hypothetical protein
VPRNLADGRSSPRRLVREHVAERKRVVGRALGSTGDRLYVHEVVLEIVQLGNDEPSDDVVTGHRECRLLGRELLVETRGR